MRVEILDKAEDDLVEGFRFYEAQQPGLGSYFFDSLSADIDSLTLYAGIHRLVYRDYHRMLSKRFPFAIFYKMREETSFVYAVLDCRKSPTWIRKRLKSIG